MRCLFPCAHPNYVDAERDIEASKQKKEKWIDPDRGNVA
jgi:hypothetical protein